MANPAPEPSPSVPERRADPAPTSGSPEPTTPPPKKEDDAALVRGILDRYAEAYTHLDADAAKAVWPSVNRAALSRAFNGLNEQRIAFNDCSVDVRSTQARATCSGSTTWEPKIGGGPRTDTRRWAFDLEKSGDALIIRDARVQNRETKDTDGDQGAVNPSCPSRHSTCTESTNVPVTFHLTTVTSDDSVATLSPGSRRSVSTPTIVGCGCETGTML
jgi:hypothetical protein